MRWFMHMSDMHRDPFVFKLMTEFKSDGYAVYCIMIEILADNDGIDKAISMEKEFLSQNLRMKFKKVNQILLRWKELKPEITYIEKDNEILFYTPKIKEIMDNWSRREKSKTTERIQSKDRVTTEETYTKTKTDTNTKTEIETKTENIVPDGTPKFNALGYFIDEYLKNLKIKYIPANPKKDGNLLKFIVTNHGVDNFKLALSRYWSKKDNFITSRKYDVTAFNSVVGILLTGSVVSKNGQKTADEVMREMRLK